MDGCAGHTYERSAITEWLKSFRTSPSTNCVLQHLRLTPDYKTRFIVDMMSTCLARLDGTEGSMLKAF